MTAAAIDLKPSDLNPFAHSFLPFIATFGRCEAEVAAAMIVCALAYHGDTWRPIRPREIGEWMQHTRETNDELWVNMFGNPFARPDMRDLAKRGYTRFVGDVENGAPIEFTEAGMARLLMWKEKQS